MLFSNSIIYDPPNKYMFFDLLPPTPPGMKRVERPGFSI